MIESKENEEEEGDDDKITEPSPSKLHSCQIRLQEISFIEIVIWMNHEHREDLQEVPTKTVIGLFSDSSMKREEINSNSIH